MKNLKYKLLGGLALTSLAFSSTSHAFCGFYVSQAGTDIFNEASKVVIMRDGDRTVMTMANDFQGDVKDFAMVIPVPTVLKEEQIHVTNNAIIDHLDAYTAPRLVEYYDDNPCNVRMYEMMAQKSAGAPLSELPTPSAESLGVTIEADYQIGEYEILILSAEQSDGLITWLKQNDYAISDSAQQTLTSYIRQGMKFFVAKVSLEAFDASGYEFLRPIQIAYEHKRFMLPIRLGMENAKGDQDLFLFALTREGRVETTNYRTVKLPSNMDIPLYVKDDFERFYQDMFAHQTQKERNKAVFTEYAWDMGWCDPCAADPLSNDELRELGVFWVNEGAQQGQNVFVTRLHVRYNGENFPEDLMLQTTNDTENFQGRYIINHPWTPIKGEDNNCSAAKAYLQTELPERQQQEAKNLANLTGWSINEIRQKMANNAIAIDPEAIDDPEWWNGLWDN